MQVQVGKGKQIRDMFGKIAPRYDFLNGLLSLGIDRSWRSIAADMMGPHKYGLVLDIATGTGDMALEIAHVTKGSARIVGVDFCREMLELAREKASASPHGAGIMLGAATCEDLPFPDNVFDSACIAFGIRNVVDRDRGLREILRVLRPGGILVVLEFSSPQSRLFRRLYHLYFHRVLPAVAGIFSDGGAYRYLPESVSEFPDRREFMTMMERAGFTDPDFRDLTFGVATVYHGGKPVISSSDTP